MSDDPPSLKRKKAKAQDVHLTVDVIGHEAVHTLIKEFRTWIIVAECERDTKWAERLRKSLRLFEEACR